MTEPINGFNHLPICGMFVAKGLGTRIIDVMLLGNPPRFKRFCKCVSNVSVNACPVPCTDSQANEIPCRFCPTISEYPAHVLVDVSDDDVSLPCFPVLFQSFQLTTRRWTIGIQLTSPFIHFTRQTGHKGIRLTSRTRGSHFFQASTLTHQ